MDVKLFYIITYLYYFSKLRVRYTLFSFPYCMQLIALFFTLLTVIGALSPLLTFLALFQQKEWRFDRLLDHLQREGVFRQLWGKVRPYLALLHVVIIIGGFWFLLQANSKEALINTITGLFIVHGTMLCLWCGLTAAQFMMHKQRMPVWTLKALLMGTVSFALFGIAVHLTTPFLILAPLLLLLQPVIVLIAWAMLLPLDGFLKTKHFLRAAAIRNTWKDATVIGIAGSVGKTTTKELLKHLLQDLHPLATPEHVNTEMGVAQWMAAITNRGNTKSEIRNTKIFIVEMGAYRKGEIALMCEFVKPTIGVMTALGSDHLALFGSEEAIVEANAELLHALPENGQAFLYADNDATRGLADGTPCAVTLVGEHKDATLRFEKVEQTEKGLMLTFDGQTSEIGLHGLHNIGNILLAMGIAKSLGISSKRIHELLESFQSLAHSFHVKNEQGVLLVDDTYNSSRLSVHAGLHWASQRKERPRVLLLSGLMETGEAESAFMQELGKAATSSVDRVIFTAETGRDSFAEGYGKPVELLSSGTEKVAAGSVLLCIGRMPLSFIQKLLP